MENNMQTKNEIENRKDESAVQQIQENSLAVRTDDYDSKKGIIVKEENDKFNKNLIEKYGEQDKKISEILKNYVDFENLPVAQYFSDEQKKAKTEGDLNKLSYGKKIKFLKECADDSSYTAGYLMLPQINSNFKVNRKSISAFLEWASKALQKRNDRYLLPEDEREAINDVLEKYINSKKFDLNKFNDVANLIHKSGSEKMLRTYEYLIQKAVNEYNAQKTKINSKYKKDKSRLNYEIQLLQQTLTKCFDVCIDGITSFIDSQIGQDSYTWYLNMSVNDLQEFFNATKTDDDYDVLKESQRKIENLLIKILAYYIKTSRKLIEQGCPINDIESKWNLNDVFDFVGSRTANQQLKLTIFKQYLGNNKQSEYLPIRLIENSLYDKTDTTTDATRAIIIDNLKDYRYGKTDKNEQTQIEYIIKNTILSSLSLSTKNHAIDKFKNEVVLQDAHSIPMINDSDLKSEIRWRLLELNIQNKQSEAKMSAFLSQIKIFQFTYQKNDSDFGFLIKTASEFRNNNQNIPQENLSYLFLSFLKSGLDFNDPVNAAVYSACIDYFADMKKKQSSLYQRTMQISLGTILQNNIPSQVKSYSLAKQLP